MKKIVLLVFVLCCCVGTSYGSPARRTIRIFTTANGLPDNTINDIQKDPEGFIWIATNKGIARFDGKNFFSFSTKNLAHFFEDNVVNEIKIEGDSIYLISKKRALKFWIGSVYASLILALKGYNLFTYKASNNSS